MLKPNKVVSPRISPLFRKMMRNAFRVEPLEERILLSADPVGALAQAVVWNAPGLLVGDTDMDKPRQGLAPGDVSLRQGQMPMVMDDAQFSVDGVAFDKALASTRSAFMESALALSDADYARFMDGVLAVPTDASSVNLNLSVDPVATFSNVDLVLGGDTQDLSPGQTGESTALDLTLSDGRFDVADLSGAMGATDVSALVVQSGAILAGSGEVPLLVVNRGLIAPGYSPGVQDMSGGLTVAAGAVMQIELGGSTPGTGAGHHDQINVTGGGLSLDGQLQVSLWGGFEPQDGDVFTFLTFDSITGGFADATGLVDVGNGLYYTLEQSSSDLSLVAHKVDSATAQLLSMLGADALNGTAGANAMGMALNAGYFSQNTSIGFNGSLALGQGLSLSGDFSLQRNTGMSLAGQTVDVWKIGLVNGIGYLGVDVADTSKPGLALSNVNVALLLADSTANDLAWVWAQGSAGGVVLQGLPGGALTADALSVDFGLGIGSLAGVSNDTLLDLSATSVAVTVGSTTFTFASPASGERATAAGTVTLTLPGSVTLSGTVGASVSDAGLWAAGSGMSALIDAGGLQLGLDQGTFGLVLLADASGYLLEARGAVVIRGGDFASVSATSAFLAMNTTGVAQAARTLQFGAFVYEMGALVVQSGPVVRVTGLHATLAGTFSLSGTFVFQRDADTGALQALATSASAALQAGAFQAGVVNTTLALVIQSKVGGGSDILLEAASADVAFALGDDLKASATSAALRWNSSGTDATGQTITVAGQTRIFGALEAGRQELALAGADLLMGNFFRVSGDFAILRSSTTVTLATDTAGTEVNEATDGLLVDLLTLGGSGLSASAGLEGAGLQLAGVQFGLAMMSARQDAQRRWTSLQASATGAAFVGLDGLGLSANTMSVSINSTKGVDAVVDYAQGKTELAVRNGAGVGEVFVLTMDGSRGELLEARGVLEIDVAGFVQLSGDFGFSKTVLNGEDRLVALGGSIDAVLVAGSASVSLRNANFGLIAGSGQTAFELKNGNFAVAIEGLSEITADGVMVQYTNADTSVVKDTELAVGALSYQFKQAIAADTVAFSVEGFAASVAGFVTLSGDLGFKKVDGDIIAVGANVSAALNVSDDVYVRLSDADFGLMAGTTSASLSTLAFELSNGALEAALGPLASVEVDSVLVRYSNENTVVAAGAEIGVGDLGYTFASGISAKTTRFELTGLRANVLDFIHIDGNIAVDSSLSDVTLANGNQVSTTVLTVGGSDVNFFVGVGGAYRSDTDNNGVVNSSDTVNPDAVGLVLDNIAFGLALFSEQGGTSRSWSALSASASAVGFAGLGDWAPSALNVAVAFNQASTDGQVIDFSGDNAFSVPTGGTAVQLTMAGARGELMRAEADVSLTLLDFAYFSGRIGFEKSAPTGELTVRSSAGVSSQVTATSMLAITGQNIDAFVGYADGGFDRSKSLTDQADNLYGFGVENLDLGVLITKAGGQSYTAVKARMDDARLYGFDPDVFELSAQGLSFEYSNKASDKSTLDYATSFGPDGLALGSSGDVVIDFAAGEHLGVYAETATLAISQFLYFSGAIGFEKADFGNTLKAGTSATTVTGATGFSIGGSNITAFVGYAENGIDRSKTLAEQASGLYGFGVDGLDFALLSLKDGSGASYTALKAHADNMAVYGFDPKDFQLSVVDLDIEYNGASVAGQELNFSGTDATLEVATGGDPMTLDFSGARIGVFAGQATLQISQFLYVQGALGFQKGDFGNLLAGATPVLAAKGFAIGGADIDVFMGYAANGLDLTKPFANQADLYGFGAEGIDFGVLSLKSSTGVSYTAAKAHADTIALYGFDPKDFELSLNSIDFQVNTASSGQALNLVSSFAATSGYSLDTGAAPILLDMTAESIGASMAKATLNIGGFVYITGAFAFEKGATQLMSAKTVGGIQVPVLANAITIGASHVQAFVGVGGPLRSDSNGDGVVTSADAIANPQAIGLVVDDFSFGLGLFQMQRTGVQFTALKANANQIGFVGFGDAIEFNLQDVQVRLNQSSSPAMVLDFSQLDGGGLDIATGDPDQAMKLDFDSELIEATVGQATASVAGIVSLSGGFTFQKRMLDEVGFHGLGMNLSLGAEALIVAGQNISAFAGINGPYRQADNSLNSDAIGFVIDDLDFALAMVSPSLGGGATLPLNFFGLSARAGYAGLVGTDPFLTLNATDVVLEFNGAIANNYPLPGVYADFSVINGGRGLDIPIGSNADAINLSFDSNFLRVGMTATLGIFDLFDISTSFDFKFELPPLDLGQDFSLANIASPDFVMQEVPPSNANTLTPSISLSGLTDLIPEMAESAPAVLKEGVKLLKDIDIRIGVDGVTGSITLPDLAINIQDFVYLNGDFKLSLGAIFTADMATGIDPLIAGAADIAINAAADAVIPDLPVGSALKYLFDLSDDYSTMHNVTFKGYTLGASNVNMFVGVGGPNFSVPFSQQSDLVGFGLQNLDIAIASF